MGEGPVLSAVEGLRPSPSRRRSGDLAEHNDLFLMGEGLRPSPPSAAVRRPCRTQPSFLDGRRSPDRAHPQQRSGDLAEHNLRSDLIVGRRSPDRAHPQQRSGDLAEHNLRSDLFVGRRSPDRAHPQQRSGDLAEHNLRSDLFVGRRSPDRALGGQETLPNTTLGGYSSVTVIFSMTSPMAMDWTTSIPSIT
jgi:hypothetical protein